MKRDVGEISNQKVGVMVELPSSPIALSSSMVTPKVQQKIPIDEAYLQYINADPDAVQGIRNVQPCSKGSGETFVSMTVLHKKHGVASSAKVYKCINGFFTLLHKADPAAKNKPKV